MSIITISRGSLSGGQALAERVAGRLGYRCVSREVLVEAAATYHVPEPKLAHFFDQMPGVWERLTTSRRLYLLVIRAAMCACAQEGRLVYHGHVGQQLLQGIGHVLKVRVISPLESRITSAMAQQGCSRAAAIRAIQQVDAQRQRRMRYLFGVDWRDPALYDLVVNLEDMCLETATDVVVYLAQHPEYQPTPASAKALNDLTLSSRVEATLAVRGIEAEVRADDGVVWVAGVVDSGEVADEIIRDAQAVPGVKEVIADLDMTPTFPYDEG
jgi:hypothetical protein